MEFTPEQLSKMVRFSFGDSPALADELSALVLSGAKTATCGAVREYGESTGVPMPQVGRQDIVLDGNNQAVCVIETTEITLKRFCDVDKAFAESEGEGTFEEWHKAHVAYFTRTGGFDPNMELVCERFKLVAVLK